jgi:hypoxanthine-guanine phosphoribosyltransferase
MSEYIGFFVPNAFVIGYGMDINEYLRDLKHLCVINQKGIERFSV